MNIPSLPGEGMQGGRTAGWLCHARFFMSRAVVLLWSGRCVAHLYGGILLGICEVCKWFL